jgi:hypothetical protein
MTQRFSGGLSEGGAATLMREGLRLVITQSESELRILCMQRTRFSSVQTAFAEETRGAIRLFSFVTEIQRVEAVQGGAERGDN